jgi:hypothetical protein
MVLDATFSKCEGIPYRQFELYQEMHWMCSYPPLTEFPQVEIFFFFPHLLLFSLFQIPSHHDPQAQQEHYNTFSTPIPHEP